MKRIFLLLIFLSIFVFSAIDECKTDVYFGNGILTKQQTAIDNALLLKKAIKQKLGLNYYNNHIGKVDYAYNTTQGQIPDLLESLLQKLGWDGLTNLFSQSHGTDLSLQIQAYKESITLGHKVLTVAHSQGNYLLMRHIKS